MAPHTVLGDVEPWPLILYWEMWSRSPSHGVGRCGAVAPHMVLGDVEP